MITSSNKARRRAGWDHIPKTRFAARDLWRPIWQAAAFCSVFVLTSCDTGKTPFATDVHKFNEEGPQQPAAITVSDPDLCPGDADQRPAARTAAVDKTAGRDRARLQRRYLQAGPDPRHGDPGGVPCRGRRQFRSGGGAGGAARAGLADLDAEVDATNKRRELVQAQTELTKAENELKEAEEAGATGAAQPPAQEDVDEAATAADPPAEATPRAKATIAELRTRIGELQNRIDRIAETFGERKVTVPIPTRNACATPIGRNCAIA